MRASQNWHAALGNRVPRRLRHQPFGPHFESHPTKPWLVSAARPYRRAGLAPARGRSQLSDRTVAGFRATGPSKACLPEHGPRVGSHVAQRVCRACPITRRRETAVQVRRGAEGRGAARALGFGDLVFGWAVLDLVSAILVFVSMQTEAVSASLDSVCVETDSVSAITASVCVQTESVSAIAESKSLVRAIRLMEHKRAHAGFRFHHESPPWRASFGEVHADPEKKSGQVS